MADGEDGGGEECEHGGEDDAGVDGGGHDAEFERGGDEQGRGGGRPVDELGGLFGLDEGGLGCISGHRLDDGLGVEHDGGPLGGGGLEGGSGGDLRGLDLEDAELR